MEQGGQIYLYQPALLTSSESLCMSRTQADIGASSFCALPPSGANPTTYGPFVDCDRHPDFALTGSQISFGFFRSTSLSPGRSAPLGTVALTDNWFVDCCGMQGP